MEPAPPTRDRILAAISELQGLLSGADLSDKAKSMINQKLDQLSEKVSAGPTSLSDLALEGETLENNTESNEAMPPLDCGFDPARKDELEQKWQEMCWRARRDMSEDEMLVITEATMAKLVNCFRHPHPEDVIVYWRYLVRLRREHQAYVAACKPTSSPPKERNAGAVVASKAAASQRTEALPEGVKSGEYSPQVFSPTAAVWQTKEVKPASERTPTTRKSPSERAGSLAGSLRASSLRRDESLGEQPGSPSSAANRNKKGNGATTPNSGRKSTTTSKVSPSPSAEFEFKANLGTGKQWKGSGAKFRNPNAWSRF